MVSIERLILNLWFTWWLIVVSWGVQPYKLIWEETKDVREWQIGCDTYFINVFSHRGVQCTVWSLFRLTYPRSIFGYLTLHWGRVINMCNNTFIPNIASLTTDENTVTLLQSLPCFFCRVHKQEFAFSLSLCLLDFLRHPHKYQIVKRGTTAGTSPLCYMVIFLNCGGYIQPLQISYLEFTWNTFDVCVALLPILLIPEIFEVMMSQVGRRSLIHHTELIIRDSAFRVKCYWKTVQYLFSHLAQHRKTVWAHFRNMGQWGETVPVMTMTVWWGQKRHTHS